MQRCIVGSVLCIRDWGEPRPLEDHDELRWISLTGRDDALNLAWIPADFPIVRALLESLDPRVDSSRGPHELRR
jgi:hypothetical protein